MDCHKCKYRSPCMFYDILKDKEDIEITDCVMINNIVSKEVICGNCKIKPVCKYYSVLKNASGKVIFICPYKSPELDLSFATPTPTTKLKSVPNNVTKLYKDLRENIEEDEEVKCYMCDKTIDKSEAETEYDIEKGETVYICPECYEKDQEEEESFDSSYDLIDKMIGVSKEDGEQEQRDPRKD